MAKPIQFLKDVKSELGKVIWPSREHTVRMTIFVIIIAAFVALILGLIDLGLNEVMEKVILN